MGRADPLRVAAAQVTGTALRCVQHRAISEDQALADIAAIVAGVPAPRRRELLDLAAAMFVISDSATPHYPPALDLMVRAGADRDRARAARQAQGAGFTTRG